jgi:hypothetical protein
MTHRNALQGSPDISIVPQKQNQITFVIAVPAGNREVTIAFNFISEHTVLSANAV